MQNQNDADRPQAELARRLNLLLDMSTVSRGVPFTAQEIIALVGTQGISLSRARWSYLINGTGPLVSDSRLLLALARIFGVEVDYLVDLENANTPPEVQAHMEMIRELRESRVHSFAARSVGDLSPELMTLISDYVKKRRGRDPQ